MGTGNINLHRASLLIEEFMRQGVRHAVLSPGSRSAPLAVAALRNKKLQVTVALDERGAGFCALGIARASGVPAIVIVTSGTAVANLHPAVAEAAARGTPLILLTADRPPELHGCGANQTMPQAGLFGGSVRKAISLPPPQCEVSPRHGLVAAAEAFAAATGAHPGPVQVNCMFREPLAPVDEAWDEKPDPELEAWLRFQRPWRCVGSRSVPTQDAIRSAGEEIRAARHGVVVVGATESTAEQAWIRRVTDSLDWPILASAGSGLRAPRQSAAVVPHPELTLAAAARAGSPMPSPDVVLRLGGPVTGKLLEAYCRSSSRIVHASCGPETFDTQHGPGTVLAGGAYGAILALAALQRNPRSSLLAVPWARLGDSVSRAVTKWARAGSELGEIAVAHACAQALGSRGTLMVGSSMPIRDLELVMDAAGARRVACNRGVSGIDGIIATGIGHGIATRRPVCILLGDVAALHDMSSLTLLAETQSPVTVVVVNNDGGGIFSHLPIASHKDVFRRAFTTPHGLEFSALARMFSMRHARPRGRGALGKVLGTALRSNRHSLIEMQVDKGGSKQSLDDLVQCAAASISGVVGARSKRGMATRTGTSGARRTIRKRTR